MNARERFYNYMHYRKLDRIPFLEWNGPWEETIRRWCMEGFPLGQRFDDYFSFDKRRETAPIDFGPIPQFVPKVIEEDDRYEICMDTRGIVRKTLKTHSYGGVMSTWLEFPVKNREDWNEMKSRFDPKDMRRYPKTWGNELIEYYNTMDHPIELQFSGFFYQGRHLMGWQRLLPAFYKDPDLVHDIMDFWANFLIEAFRKFVGRVKVDYAVFNEDLAYKHGPAISPKIFEEFILPNYKKVTRFLKDHDIDIIGMDSDGNFEVLIPLLLEGGINCLEPLEVVCGMDAPALREQYGKRLLLIGNINKLALVKGKKAIKMEVDRKFALAKEGGYIPSIDHTIPADISLENYKYYVNLYTTNLEPS